MVTLERSIIEITHDALDVSVDIIRRAFGTVADEIGITLENCPAFPAFITVEKLEEMRERGGVFFGFFTDGLQVGFVAVEKERDDQYYLKRLAVLPEYRHAGFGRELVDFVIDYVNNQGISRLCIAIVNEQTGLKDWYKKMGFRETSVREFEHLPFSVCFMETEIKSRKNSI